MSGFTPIVTATIAATSTSGGTTISAVCDTLELTNIGPNTVFVRWGNTAPTAVNTDYPIPNGQSRRIFIGTGITNIAAVCNSTETATLYVSQGVNAT